MQLSIELPTESCDVSLPSCTVELLISHFSPKFDQRNEVSSTQSTQLLETEVEDVADPEVDDYLDILDPKEWKDQDHYLVLGLHHLRYKATQEDIKAAYMKQALRHHPDKLAAKNINSDNIFKCIRKACETLSCPIKKMQYDSVDPSVPDIPVDSASLKLKVEQGSFYSFCSNVFKLESRFFNKIMPEFGDENATKVEVNSFYTTWYTSSSLRSFEYLDKEEVDTLGNRDDKRWSEKKNKAERARRKQDESRRLVRIIETINLIDPRIKKFREDEKRLKAEQKMKKK